MAPRLRSGKGFTKDEILAHQQALRAGIANTTGLPALPTELLFEIISHFPAVPLPMGRRNRDSVYPASYLEKHRILRAFSQMCRSLRSIFLPYVWQKIEVCANPRIPDEISVTYAARLKRKLVSRELATELISQLEIVTIRDPTLAQHVQIVNVLLTEFSTDTVVTELVRCLALFPNLHTIQLFSDTWRVVNAVNIAFNGKQFPSVHTLNVNPLLFSILASFPEVRHVSVIGSSCGLSTSSSIGPSYVGAMAFDKGLEKCPKLEVLRGLEDVNYQNFPLIHRMVQGFPKTRTMILDAYNFSLTLEELKRLSFFPHLTCIEFYIPAKSEAHMSPRDKELIRAAEGILRDKPGVDGLLKWMVLKFISKTSRVNIP